MDEYLCKNDPDSQLEQQLQAIQTHTNSGFIYINKFMCGADADAWRGRCMGTADGDGAANAAVEAKKPKSTRGNNIADMSEE